MRKLGELIFKSFFQPTGVLGVPGICQAPCRVLGICWQTGPAPSLLSGQQNIRECQSQDCPETLRPRLETQGCVVWARPAPGQQEQRGTCCPKAASPPPNCISWPTSTLASTLAPCVRGHLRACWTPCLPLFGANLAGNILAHSSSQPPGDPPASSLACVLSKLSYFVVLTATIYQALSYISLTATHFTDVETKAERGMVI